MKRTYPNDFTSGDESGGDPESKAMVLPERNLKHYYANELSLEEFYRRRDMVIEESREQYDISECFSAAALGGGDRILGVLCKFTVTNPCHRSAARGFYAQLRKYMTGPVGLREQELALHILHHILQCWEYDYATQLLRDAPWGQSYYAAASVDRIVRDAAAYNRFPDEFVATLYTSHRQALEQGCILPMFTTSATSTATRQNFMCAISCYRNDPTPQRLAYSISETVMKNIQRYLVETCTMQPRQCDVRTYPVRAFFGIMADLLPIVDVWRAEGFVPYMLFLLLTKQLRRYMLDLHLERDTYFSTLPREFCGYMLPRFLFGWMLSRTTTLYHFAPPPPEKLVGRFGVAEIDALFGSGMWYERLATHITEIWEHGECPPRISLIREHMACPPTIDAATYERMWRDALP